MTLRAGRTDLHQQLVRLLGRMDHRLFNWSNPSDRAEIALLLAKARDAVLHCPVDGCAYCFAVEQQEATDHVLR